MFKAKEKNATYPHIELENPEDIKNITINVMVISSFIKWYWYLGFNFSAKHSLNVY